jgi:Tol biopolymer transport system component
MSRPDGTGVRRVTRSHNLDDPPFDKRPTWSPDGKEIAFVSGNIEGTIPAGIYIVRVGSGVVRRLTPDPWWSLAWSPNGRTLAATTFEGSLHFIDVVTGRLSTGRRVPGNSIGFSPDGRSLAVGGETGVFVLRLADGRTRRVARARGVTSVSWSPNAKSIAFTAQGPRESDVFVVGADGQGLRRLNGRGYEHGVSWRP